MKKEKLVELLTAMKNTEFRLADYYENDTDAQAAYERHIDVAMAYDRILTALEDKDSFNELCSLYNID